MGVKALRRIQLAYEAAAGTALATTEIWRGTGVLNDEREIVFPEEDVGSYMPRDRSYIPQLNGTVTLDDTPATYEQLPILFSIGIENVNTGTIDSSGYSYTFDIIDTVAGTKQTLAIEAGDDQRQDSLAYVYAEEITLSGAKGEAVTMGATLRGQQVVDTSFTAAPTLTTVEEILFQKGKLYVDATTVGTTQLTTTWHAFDLTIPTGWKALHTADGNLYFTSTVFRGYRENEITGSITLEHDALAEAEITAARNETVRLIRMEFLGSALTTADTYTYKTLRMDMAVRYTAVPSLEDEEGDDIVTLPFKSVYDATAPVLGAQIIVVNNLQTLGVGG
jgi:hypothetical protein